MREHNGRSELRDPDSFDPRGGFRRLKRAIFGHKWLVAFTVMVAVGLVLAYTALWPPVYSAKVLFMAEAQDDAARDSFYMGWNVFRKDDVATEANMFTSGPVLEEVVRDMDLGYDDVYHPFMAHATYLWTESWIGKKYRAFKQWIFPPSKSPWDPTDEEIDFARTMHDLKTGVGVEPLGEANAAYLVVNGPTARVAVMANKIVEVYLRHRRERHEEEARHAYDILEKETQQALGEVERIEAAKEKFYQDNNLLLEFDVEKLRIANLMELEGSLNQTKGTLAALEATLAEVDDQLAREEPTKIASRTFERDEVRQAMELKLFSYETIRTELLNRYLPDSPEVKEFDHNISSVTSMLSEMDAFEERTYTEVLNQRFEVLKSRRDSLVGELASTRAGFEASEREIDRMRESLAVLPAVMTGIEELAREQHLAQQKYIKLAEKRVEAEVSMITAATTMPSIRVMEDAVAPSNPDWPKTKYLLLGAISIGLAAGVGLALLRDLYENRVSSDDIELGRGDALFLAKIEVGEKRSNGGVAVSPQSNGGRRSHAGSP